MRDSTRRELIGTAAVGAAGAAFASVPPAWARHLLSSRAGVGPGKFRDGVASGEPSPHAVTFWSRLATHRPRSGARLIVAKDDDLRRVVATAVVPTGRGINGTLKVRVGGLKPSTEYYYAWESAGDFSPIGRTRTRLPKSSGQPLSLAFSSCQDYALGYFTPHAHAAAQDLDLYVFLGDYTYERRRKPSPGEPRQDPINANDLRSYRRNYRLYRSDEGLRELHRMHPMVHIWDDHEVANNYTDNYPGPAPLQRAAAYRAAFEWLPRIVYPSDRYRIYKRIRLGKTADLFLLDERQYRTVDDAGEPVKMLGDAQMQWLIAGLRGSRAKWKLIANQVVIAPMEYGGESRPHNWGESGGPGAQLLGAIERAGIENVVFLTGNAHVFMTNLLASDPEAFGTDTAKRASAIEYVAGSVTSQGIDRSEQQLRDLNPWNLQYNALAHGYAHLAVNASELVTEYRRSDLFNPAGATYPFERFRQPAGANAVTRESFQRPV